MPPPSALPPLLQYAPAPIASIDLGGMVVDVNQALLDTSGYARGDVVGRPFADLFDPAEAAAAPASFRDLAAGVTERYRVSRRYRRSSGEMRDAELTVALVRGADGAPLSCLAVVQDVTDHARGLDGAARQAAVLEEAQHALRLSEARYRALVEQSPLSVQILSPDGRTVQVNAAWERLWGVTLEQLGDYNLLEDAQLVERGLMPIIRRAFEGEAGLLPAEVYDPDRTLPNLSAHKDPRRWVRAVIYPVKDEHGALREVVLIHEDITDRVRADEERREATELLQLVVQQSGEAILVSDPQGVLRIFNPASERLHGIDGGTTPQEQWADRYGLLRIDGTPLPLEETPLFRAVKGDTIVDARWLVRRPDGSTRTLAGTAAPLHRPDGTPAGAVLIARDETDRLAAEAERERLLVTARDTQQDLEVASRLKDEFLATLSHELRTPLNAVLGWTRILRGQPFDAATQRALSVIERNASAQARLIDDLLEVSRIITGKLQLDIQPVDLSKLAASALETVTPAADAKGVRLECTLDANLPALRGDLPRLQQVLWNLLSNAVKFTDAGGRVSLAIAHSGPAVLITVSDTGAGIAPATLPHVFERFMQGDSSTTRAHSGLGLGLAIVRHLVELHGGTVTAESDGGGHGATFRVWLPLAVETTRSGPS